MSFAGNGQSVVVMGVIIAWLYGGTICIKAKIPPVVLPPFIDLTRNSPRPTDHDDSSSQGTSNSSLDHGSQQTAQISAVQPFTPMQAQPPTPGPAQPFTPAQAAVLPMTPQPAQSSM
eukprot:13533711-Alexandrium_andersonii.AAC.1